ncbi:MULTISPECIES: flagellin [Clostridium]|uniref:flagellin n=1 Tax=Clostridium TaxID=1485 RepID=UPI00129B545C|nr:MULTISPECIES: flagellin [Clostridium]MDU1068730.1 flagellin [Clostridium sp.]MDU1336973.1 flagellin [Clostridium butyricum]MDU2676314.1 flagellin [Clostridium sp.]MDU4210649.1 flagellin [Clostridium sp.]MDU5173919.1 flagellin [Clostridium sp.]
MRLNKNIFSLNIYRTYKNNISSGSKALNNISSGVKINSAKDNPSKIGQNQNLKISILSSQRAEHNIQDTNSMLQTFDGSMQEMNDTLNRIRELTIQASNEALSSEDISSIQDEVDQLKNGIEDIVNNTKFNGINMSDKSVSGLESVYKKSLIGAMGDETVEIPYFNMSIENLGIDKLDMLNGTENLGAIDKAINMVSTIRGNYGAIQNSLEETAENLSAKNINLQSAQSKIGDADVAKEYIEYSTSQILIQSSISLIAQANQIPQDALQIIGNIPR